MADFTSLTFNANVNSTAAVALVQASGAGHETRFWNSASASTSTPSASWPALPRPASGTTGVDYAYVFTDDTTGYGILAGAGVGHNPPTAFTIANYKQAVWVWDDVGTFASAPIYTAYASAAHGAITRGNGSILGGHASDTGATARSYLKGNAWGRVSSGGIPTLAPNQAPVVTDGATGSMSPTAGANWLASGWQGLQGDNDYITAPFTPAAGTADSWYVMFRLFMGANLGVGTLTFVFSLRYTYT